MKIQFLVLILIISIVIPLSVFSQGKFTLKPEEVSEATNRLAAISQTLLIRMREQPAGLKGIPEGLSDRVHYYNPFIAGKEIFVAIDLGAENPVLYADTNGDGNLADEKPVINMDLQKSAKSSSEEFNELRFAPIKVVIPDRHGKKTVSMGIDTAKSGGYIYYFPTGICRGNIKFGDQTYSLILMDRNINGLYNDFAAENLNKPYDYIGIDLNNNGIFDSTLAEGEVSPLAEAVSVKGNYYSIKPSADGNTVEVKTLKPKIGTLDVQNLDMEISTQSQWGARTFSGSNGKWELPEGKYLTRLIRMKKKDEGGREWILTSYSFNAGKLASFDIKSGKTTTIPAGAPLRIETTTIMQGDSIEVSASFIGRAGEQYSSGPTVDGQRPEPPKFKIVDKSGKELASGAFQYG